MEGLILKENRLSAIGCSDGSIDSCIDYRYGIYSDDMRLIKYYNLSFPDIEMMPITVRTEESYKHTYLYNNKEFNKDGKKYEKQSLLVKRDRVVNNIFAERVTIENFSKEKVELFVKVEVDVDFYDIFEVRGDITNFTKKIETVQNEKELSFSYKGLDDKEYNTTIACNKSFDVVGKDINIHLEIEGRSSSSFEIYISPFASVNTNYLNEYEDIKDKYRKWQGKNTSIITDNPEINSILKVSTNDLRTLMTNIEGKDFYCAGIPFFMTLFGRDGIIAALFSGIFNKDILKSTLEIFNLYRGKEVKNYREEEPGKIIHELRLSEMPTAGLSPFGKYYGSVDSTLLYLILAIKYYKETGDKELILNIKEGIIGALKWMDDYGDFDNDGYIEYIRKSNKGLVNQGWKDSKNCIVHKDGTQASYPHALCEIQGYSYYIKNNITDILTLFGEYELDSKLKRDAIKLKNQFNKDFWMENRKFFALGIDGDKKQIDSVTSNVGHLLFTGIIDEEKVAYVTEKLVSKEMFSGYGIRTLSVENDIYNPMSYHNGAVWPHDTAFSLLGLAEINKKEEFDLVAKGILEAADNLGQLPELFCGFEKSDYKGPIPYGMTCRPQAWAAATPFIIMEKYIGIDIVSKNKQILINPITTSLFNEVKVDNLKCGNGELGFIIKDNKIVIKKNTTGYEVVTFDK